MSKLIGEKHIFLDKTRTWKLLSTQTSIRKEKETKGRIRSDTKERAKNMQKEQILELTGFEFLSVSLRWRETSGDWVARTLRR